MLATVDFRLELTGGDQCLPMVYPMCRVQDVNHVCGIHRVELVGVRGFEPPIPSSRKNSLSWDKQMETSGLARVKVDIPTGNASASYLDGEVQTR